MWEERTRRAHPACMCGRLGRRPTKTYMVTSTSQAAGRWGGSSWALATLLFVAGCGLITGPECAITTEASANDACADVQGSGPLVVEAWIRGGPGRVPFLLHSWRRAAYRAGQARSRPRQLRRRGARGAARSGPEGARS